MSLTRIKAEQIPNCYFLGKTLARLRIYRNKKISPDPTGRQKYLVSPRGWELLEEYSCPIENGILHVPTIELEPTYTNLNGLPAVRYIAVVVDEKGAERCSVLSLYSLMKGHKKVIDGYDETGVARSITLVNVRILKTNEFISFISSDGQTLYAPKADARLEFVKEIKCVKQGRSLTVPLNTLTDGNSSLIYILLEEVQKGKPSYLATIHFEKDESNPSNWRPVIYKNSKFEQLMFETDPIPECGYLGKSAILRLYHSRKFWPDPTDENKYVSELGSDKHVKDIHCSIKDSTLYIPMFSIDVETDTEGNPTVIYTAMLVDENGVERGALFSDKAFESVSGSKESPSIVKLGNTPNPRRNPLKVYRSRSFHFYLNEGRKAYEPKPESLEYVMDISYEIKDGSLILHQWTIDIDDKDIKQDGDDTPNVIFRGMIIDGGIEKIAFTGHIAGVPPQLITYKSDQSKIIVKLFKRSPFRLRNN